MAYRVAPKLLSTTHDTYRHPYLDQYDYKWYHPQLFTNSLNHYGATEKFFSDYRRCHITEQVLAKNREGLDKIQRIRPAWNTDSPDRVLGRRKFDREAMFPIIQNKPVYTLTNRVPDRERDRDKKFRNETGYHRSQFKDLTGSIQPKAPYFHIPETSDLTFHQRTAVQHEIGAYPGHHRAAQDFTYNLERADPLVQYMKNDVY